MLELIDDVLFITPVTPTATPADGGDGSDDSGGTVNNSGDNNSKTTNQQQQPPSNINNNSLPKEVSVEELELLKKLEAANR